MSKKVLFLGVSKKTVGGMTAVLVSYDKYIEKMRFIPTWKLGNKLIKTIYILQALIRAYILFLFDRHIEIVHIHGAANASFSRCSLFIRLSKSFKKKVILHEHAADFKEFYNDAKDKNTIINTINKCDYLIVLSNSWKEYYQSIGVDKSKIIVLNNIVSHPDATNITREDDKLHLMYMGEISNRKGTFDLLKAVVKHKEYFKDKLLLRIGGNEVDGNIKAYIHDNGLSSFVFYEGWISGQKKIDLLKWKDVYILPSYNEGLPIAILEAMSYKSPIISTPVGGIPEVVHQDINGKLVEPGNIDEIFSAIKYYIENRDQISIHGTNSSKYVQPFYPEEVFHNLMNVYNSLSIQD